MLNIQFPFPIETIQSVPFLRIPEHEIKAAN